MLITLIALAAAGTAEPQPAEWRTCVISTAQRWAMNRDGADVVADGAIGACQSSEPATVSDTEMRRVRQAAIAAVLTKRRP